MRVRGDDQSNAALHAKPIATSQPQQDRSLSSLYLLSSSHKQRAACNAMVSLLVLVVILAVVTHIVNTLGAQQINNLLWSLYNALPISSSRSDVASQRALRHEVVTLRAQLRSTSSQDEFAKWAKLKRTLEKKLEDLEKLTASISSVRLQFDSKANVLRWTLTSGLRIFIQFWYTREAVFWIPEGWVPGYIEWGLSFPKAPIGSVSIQVWSFAVGQVVTLLSGLVAYFFAAFAIRFMAPKAVPMSAAGAGAGEGEKRSM